MVHLQDSISECLHHHTFINMFFDRILEAHCARILSCSSPWVGICFIVWLIFPTFWLSSPISSILFQTWLRLPHFSIIGIPWCVCTHPIDLMGIHFLRCAHRNECMGTHEVVYDTFVAIAWDVGFHVGQKKLHALLLGTFNSSHQQIDIVLTKDGIRTLVDIVIVNPTCVIYFPNLAQFKDLLLLM